MISHFFFAGNWVYIAAIVLILLLIALTLFAYSGGFHVIDIKVGLPPFRRLYVAYKFQKNSYDKCHSVFRELYSHASVKEILGIYYDDPKVVSVAFLGLFFSQCLG